ncbi:glycosyltransferase family 1 protein [Planctomycetales bacterium ZRK34]|nr:glycosyltransferase family 1 protein [Planctomycetales bacterium ZRK34]
MLSPDQARIHSFKVVPSLPEPLEPLLKIARNLWWSWNPDAIELFIRVDADLWRSTRHNPVRMLGSCSQSRLEELASDESFLSAMRRVEELLDDHVNDEGWFARKNPDAKDACIAYFSAEFGLTECLQVYSGGLGILAGDHLKAASELALPLVGVGLLYRNGYFQQYLNADGWQQEFYPELDFTNLPIRPVHDDSGEQLVVEVDLPGRVLHIAIWEVKVGRIRLFLLDTNLPENEPDDRGITSQLYGGDMELRIKQEIVLGIGGVRALTKMGIDPTVLHMNEGHAAFLALEHIRMLIAEHDMSFDEARQAAASMHLFTTHTPVPAGIDRFPPEMIQRYFKNYHASLRLDMEGLLALGRENVANKNEFFSMAVLAIRTADAANGVSKLHGKVSREMWGNIWPRVPTEEVPIGHVTNGVHARTWLSPDLIWLYDRYLPRNWKEKPHDQTVWESVKQIPDEELWRVHEHRRQRLVHWVRRAHREQIERRGASSMEIDAVDELFDHNALTIGFARRFATYKRANLLFRDPHRLMKILCDKDRPVQLVIAGKAHPADTQGKELIRQIVHFARENGASRRVVFIENYNMHVARYMVQGCDVWLNTPRRGMEASGTSGMKAALNGVLNCSILDGWWDEAWIKDTGWAIGRGEAYTNYDYQDQVESHSLYDLLEKHLVPLYYNRDDNGLPREWVTWMKNCMMAMAPVYNTNRMVYEYTQNYYLPSHHRSRNLMSDKLRNAAELAHYVGHLRGHWGGIRVENIEANTTKPLGVRQPLEVSADVKLNELSPESVRVQIYYGTLDTEGRIQDGKSVDMKHVEHLGEGRHRYQGEVSVDNSGKHGLAVRVIPGDPALATPFVPGLISWDVAPAPSKAGAAVGASA